ncbi:hypothetical protein [Azospirillum agricola]|uniref:hypothetical protein n=1 Tax=Azospirillum agricola TaxID=1720247 RepID=UPI001F46A500|nr:hypothetical protein [Azospirillum agricola]
MVLGVAACSERALDTGLLGSVTGEPSPVSDNPSPIRAMTGERTDYPNLGTVPPRPTDLTTEAQRQTEMDRLAKDREASRQRKAATEAIPMPEPLPTPMSVPPKPNLQPGRS